MTYCYKCQSCGAITETQSLIAPRCPTNSRAYMVRDYRTENAGFYIPGYMKSSNTSDKDDFLPTAKDFEKPGDPDGGNGIREWNENHEGAAGNKSPQRPSIPAGSRKILPLGDGKRK